MGWLFYALVSAGSAALPAILAKIGVAGIPPIGIRSPRIVNAHVSPGLRSYTSRTASTARDDARSR